MKKLERLRLMKGTSEILSEKELKNVFGGSYGSYGSGGGRCIATQSLDNGGNYNSYRCFYYGDGASQATAWAGANGWWCCNCKDAVDWCYSIQ